MSNRMPLTEKVPAIICLLALPPGLRSADAEDSGNLSDAQPAPEKVCRLLHQWWLYIAGRPSNAVGATIRGQQINRRLERLRRSGDATQLLQTGLEPCPLNRHVVGG